MTSVERVAVIGGGVMGNGIVQVVAGAGLDVTLIDVSDAAALVSAGHHGRKTGRGFRAY